MKEAAFVFLMLMNMWLFSQNVQADSLGIPNREECNYDCRMKTFINKAQTIEGVYQDYSAIYVLVIDDFQDSINFCITMEEHGLSYFSILNESRYFYKIEKSVFVLKHHRNEDSVGSKLKLYSIDQKMRQYLNEYIPIHIYANHDYQFVDSEFFCLKNGELKY